MITTPRLNKKYIQSEAIRKKKEIFLKIFFVVFIFLFKPIGSKPYTYRKWTLPRENRKRESGITELTEMVYQVNNPQTRP